MTTDLPKPQQPLHRESWWFRPPFVVGILAVYFGIAIIYALQTPHRQGGYETAGQFGDMFGAFNAVVSGIAMLGVVAAIFMQRIQLRLQSDELRLQRQELEETRKELRGQK